MSGPDVYVPKPEGLALAFHQQAVATGVLHLQRCDLCGAFRHPPRYRCPACFSPDWTFVPSSQRGAVYSYVVTHRSFDRGWAPFVPHVTVAVAVEEGPRVIAALRGAPGAVALGMPVRLSVEPKGQDFALVWAELVSE